MDVGQRVYDLRRKNGYRQEEFSNALGISRVTLSRIENGTAVMNVLILLKMAAVLKVSVEDVLGEG